jgi:hypothetical protein
VRQNKAATQMQRIVRGFIGRRRYARRVRAAREELNRFWDMNNNLKMLAKEKKRIEMETRHKVK